MSATGQPGATLRLDADLARLAEVRAFVRGHLRDLGADGPTIDDIVGAVDEWVTNVCVHGYRGAGGPVEVELARDQAGFVVRVRDRAPVFDPAGAATFDPSVPLERRRPGGMGIYLMREVMDTIGHRALPGGGNELTMRRDVRPAPTGGNA